MKWHEACLSISAAILEILNAWENGVLAFESIQVLPFYQSLSLAFVTLSFFGGLGHT